MDKTIEVMKAAMEKEKVMKDNSNETIANEVGDNIEKEIVEDTVADQDAINEEMIEELNEFETNFDKYRKELAI